MVYVRSAGTGTGWVERSRLRLACGQVRNVDRRAGYRQPVTTDPAPDQDMPAPTRFLTLEEVAAELNVSRSQAYALVRDRSLLAIKIGGRGQWRIERCKLEDYIAQLYLEAAGH